MYKIWFQVANLKIRLKFVSPLFVVISDCGDCAATIKKDDCQRLDFRKSALKQSAAI
jgi:hypothetical protein